FHIRKSRTTCRITRVQWRYCKESVCRGRRKSCVQSNHSIEINVIILKDILYKVKIDAVYGKTDTHINAIHFDSRKVSLDDAFVAIPGTAVDGHDFISKAIENGAIAIICENLPEELINGVTYI